MEKQIYFIRMFELKISVSIKYTNYSMESALYGIYALVVFVSENLLVRFVHYVNNSSVNTVRARFPRK